MSASPAARTRSAKSATHPAISWTDAGKTHVVRWQSEAGLPPPQRVIVVDDRITADEAMRATSEGTALLWRGDFQNARQLLQAMRRRIDQRAARHAAKNASPVIGVDAFHRQRMQRAQRARTLGLLLLPFDAGHRILLNRAPDVRDACTEAHGPARAPYVMSLRELLGLIGAHEWRTNGILVAALGGARIHPHYGVFGPVRSEYVDLVAAAALAQPLPAVAFDIGTGTGVLAAVLAKRGISRVIATDNDPRALACAAANIDRLGLEEKVEIRRADLFPGGQAGLIVCNPPWLPGRPSSALDKAIYDPDQQMLRGFLRGLPAHLSPGGEGWLVLSDLAEHLGLRTREALLALFAEAGLEVIEQLEIRPDHPRMRDAGDPLHAARAAEVTSLWRLGAQPTPSEIGCRPHTN